MFEIIGSIIIGIIVCLVHEWIWPPINVPINKQMDIIL